jgi:hypothetical protein
MQVRNKASKYVPMLLNAIGSAALIMLTALSPAIAQSGPPPSRLVDDPIPHRTEGVGPYKRLILRGAYMIDGTGAPAQGPIDLVVTGDRITQIKLIGAPGRIEESRRPEKGDHELDLTGNSRRQPITFSSCG